VWTRTTLEPGRFERQDIVAIDNVCFHKVLGVDDAIRLAAQGCATWPSNQFNRGCLPPVCKQSGAKLRSGQWRGAHQSARPFRIRGRHAGYEPVWPGYAVVLSKTASNPDRAVCRIAINCENLALCAMQQQLSGSSAILVHRTALCLPPIGRKPIMRPRGLEARGSSRARANQRAILFQD
jgi:hypothetical protein